MTVKELINNFSCTEVHFISMYKLKRQDRIERIKQKIKLGRPLCVHYSKTFPASVILGKFRKISPVDTVLDGLDYVRFTINTHLLLIDPICFNNF